MSVPSTTRFLDVSNSGNIYERMDIGQDSLTLLTHLNLSYCDITAFPINLFYSLRKLKVLNISYNRIGRLTTGLFLYQSELETFILTGNLEIIVFESESFTGMSALQELLLSELNVDRISQDAFANLELETLKIYHSAINSFETRSLGNLRAKGIYLNSSKIKEISKFMFDGVEGIQVFKTDEYRFCCERPSTLSEENCFPKQDEFSSCDDLIRNDVLIPLIWIMGFFSIIANSASLVYRLMNQKEQLKRNYGIFVSHLAVSDCLMGVYLLIIASADTHYRGIYIYYDEKWRNSIWCQIAGILSVISSEASVLFICLITLDRFLVVKYPLGQVKIDLRSGKKFAFIVWVIVVLISIIPLALHPVFEGKFYSVTGTCLSLPITRVKPPGWAYSFAISIGFNSFSCILVGYGQCLIYKEIQASKKKMAKRRSAARNDARLTRNLLIVVLSNVFCWLPICVLGILELTDNPIQVEVYSWMAIVDLPINSAVNPVIYTLLAVCQKKEDPNDDIEERVYTDDDLVRTAYIWNKKPYWQYPFQEDGYIALLDVLENDSIPAGHRLVLVRDISKLVHTLHEQSWAQENLKLDDIFVSVRTKAQGNAAMVLRLKNPTELTDMSKNINSMGIVFEKLAKIP